MKKNVGFSLLPILVLLPLAFYFIGNRDVKVGDMRNRAEGINPYSTQYPTPTTGPCEQSHYNYNVVLHQTTTCSNHQSCTVTYIANREYSVAGGNCDMCGAILDAKTGQCYKFAEATYFTSPCTYVWKCPMTTPTPTR
jgi:hypothetical protein